MTRFSRIFQYFQALSLDVSLGGVIGCMFVSSYLGIHVDPKTYLVLAITIWLIYTLDHLMDIQNTIDPPITFRHRFHWNNATTMWGVWSFLLIVVFSIIYKLPPATLFAGFVVSVFVLLYFLSLKILKNKNIYYKEVFAALIYTVGIFLPSVSLNHEDMGLDIWLLFVEMFSLAYINLLIFSIFERMIDKQEGYHSLVKTLGVESVRGITWGLILAVGVISLAGLYLIDNQFFVYSQFLILGMDICFTLIMFRRDFFIKRTRYRIFGDAVFFLPIIYLIMLHEL